MLSWFVENKIKVFRYMVSSGDGQGERYTDKREETVFGEKWEGTERGARKLLGYRTCREGCGKAIPGKARELCCCRVFCLAGSYCERWKISLLDLGVGIYCSDLQLCL